MSFHAIIFDEVYPIFAATGHGRGLDFTSNKIAVSLSLMGPVVFIAALLLFPLLYDRCSALTLCRASACLFAVVYPIFSLLPAFTSSCTLGKVVKWGILFTLLAIRFAANVIGYTSFGILVS